MGNIAKHDRRSQLTRSAAGRIGPNGLHHNPQDFSHLAGADKPSRAQYLRKNWHYMPATARRVADSLSGPYRPHAQQLSLALT